PQPLLHDGGEGVLRRAASQRGIALTGLHLNIYCAVRGTGGSRIKGRRWVRRNAGRAREGRRVVRKRDEAFQEAVREGRDPERDPEARALREAVGEAQEEGARGEEARAQEGSQGHDVAP